MTAASPLPRAAWSPLVALVAAGAASGLVLIHATAAIAMRWGSGVPVDVVLADAYAPGEFPFIVYHTLLGATIGLGLGMLARSAYETQLREEARARDLERQLLRSQKMESVGRLASGVAHDFNNFLAALGVHLHLAAEALPPNHPATEHVARADLVAKRAANLPRQLLSFSSRRAAEARPVDPNATVESVERMCAPLLAGVRATLRLRRVPRVRIDPGQLEQLLINLCVNARDAMPRGGEITIDTDEIVVPPSGLASFPGLSAGSWVRIRVADTGVGMTPEVRERAFEPFFTTKEPGRGTGLGLAVCYAIADRNGGRIGLESAPGIGTTFTILLPATDDSPETPAGRAATATTPLSGRTVLVVEDQADVREGLARILSRAGLAVHTAADGEEAMRVVRGLPAMPDVVLTDVTMPRMDGIELAARLRAETPDVRVVFMTGREDTPLPEGSRVVAKPFDPAAVVATLAEAAG